MNERYDDKNAAPQYDPEAARIRRALRAQKARRRKKMRSRRLFLLGMALILLFVLVPNLWGRAERLLYPRKYEVLVNQWAETYGLDPLLVGLQDAVLALGGKTVIDIAKHDLVALGPRKNLCDAAAHGTGAENRDFHRCILLKNIVAVQKQRGNPPCSFG